MKIIPTQKVVKAVPLSQVPLATPFSTAKGEQWMKVQYGRDHTYVVNLSTGVFLMASDFMRDHTILTVHDKHELVLGE